MSDHCIVDDVLEYLHALVVDQVRPTEARARLRSLREHYPETTLELLWEEEAYDGSVHYDVLARLDEHGTTSLSYCADRAQPWPLRGVQRWTDQELLRVNHFNLPVSQAVACLDLLWDQAPLVDRLVNVCLVQEELDRQPVDLSEEELQQAMDGFRRTRRLLSAQDTTSWLKRRGMTHIELESLVADEAVVAKLRRRVTDGRVAAYFETHQPEFDTAHVARIAFTSEDEADAAAQLVRSGALDFYALAEQRCVSNTMSDGLPAAFEIVRRGTPSNQAIESILAARPDEVVGPVSWGGVPSLVRILSVTAAQLDRPTFTAIERLLFDQWLEERRAGADIEWFWWNAARTRPAVAA